MLNVVGASHAARMGYASTTDNVFSIRGKKNVSRVISTFLCKEIKGKLNVNAVL